VKPVAQKKKSAKKRPKKAAEKKAAKKKLANKKDSGSRPRKEAQPIAARYATAAPPPSRRRTDKDGTRAVDNKASPAANDASGKSHDVITPINIVRLINNMDRKEHQREPLQTGVDKPPEHIGQVADGVAEQEDRLELIAPELTNADTNKLLQLSLWWAGGMRLPRAAFVGRALHELKSIDEELAPIRGTADKICQRIRRNNANQLRLRITQVMDRHSKGTMSAEDAASALVGHLNKTWAVLEALGLLKAAYPAGVYLVGDGLTVFDGFPDWKKVDDKLPKKPARPPKTPRP
jgi:hypothetical protein